MLGLAAIASSIARQPDDDRREPADAADTAAGASGGSGSTAAATGAAAGAAGPVAVRFSQRRAPQTRSVGVDVAATVLVEVAVAGQVRIPSLGLTAPAEPLTPARFDVLLDGTGEHVIELDPAAAAQDPVRIGALRASPPS